MDIKAEIEKTEAKLNENAQKIEQLKAILEATIAQGNKILGRLELLKEMEGEDETKD